MDDAPASLEGREEGTFLFPGQRGALLVSGCGPGAGMGGWDQDLRRAGGGGVEVNLHWEPERLL